MAKKRNVKSSQLRLGTIIFCAVSLLLVTTVSKLIEPTFENVRYKFGQEQWNDTSLPFFEDTSDEKLYVELEMHLLPIHPNNFHVKPDDCTESLIINSREVDSSISNYCDYTDIGPVLNLSNYVTSGTNSIEFLISDHGGKGGLRIQASKNDPIFLFITLIQLALAAGLTYCLIGLFEKKGVDKYLLVTVVLGILLRIYYVSITPFRARSHDVGGHIDYINYVASNLAVPPANNGWEFHQAPLYYFVSGLWMKLRLAMGAASEHILEEIQTGSLVISIGLLIISVWIAFLLFPKKNQSWMRTAFCAISAFSPILVFLSSRVTNNGVYTALGFLSFGLILNWWKKGDLRSMILVAIGTSITCITRVSGLIFIPIVGTVLLGRKKPSLKKKVQQGLVYAAIFTILVGWLPVVRFIIEEDHTNSLTFSSQSMNGALRVETNIKNFSTFNPIKMIEIPFVHAWKDETRRMNFWEYFFRSFFFGEFEHKKSLQGLGSVIIFISMCLFLPMALGLIACIRNWREELPIVITFVISMASQIWYRLYAPFSANQDFRFSVILIIPLSYFLVKGMRNTILRTNGMLLIGLWSGLCGLFLVLL